MSDDMIGNFIDAIAAGDFNNSEKIFNSIIGDKVTGALDAERIAVADTIFNGAEPQQDEMDDETAEFDADSELE